MLEKKTLVSDPVKLDQRVAEIPPSPGCYLFRDQYDHILYIGKSKNLQSRVRSYFRPNSEISSWIKLMIKQINNIEIIITDNESEALTLESNLIKQNQPHFNTLLKDDKKYPYVCITWSEEYPRIFITRRRRERRKLDRYYGPFVDVRLLRNTLIYIQKFFPLRQRVRPLYKDRTCLNYNIGKCPGVCQGEITPEEYNKIIKRVAMIFQGRAEELVRLLHDKMFLHSSNHQYEEAALIRDQLKGLAKLSEQQKMIIPDSSVSRDIIGFSSNKRIASFQLFQMRSGKLVNRIGYISDAKDIDDIFILQRLIEEHYSNVEGLEIASEILIPYKLPHQSILIEWLTELKGTRVKLTTPKRLEKASLVELVTKNAEIELSRLEKGYQMKELAIEDISQILGLTYLPRRIEGYDISHIQGTNVVASQVVFIDGIPAKQHYRKYNIKSTSIHIGHSDDFMSMAEVIRRRFRKWSRLKKEGFSIKQMHSIDKSKLTIQGLDDWPDLIVIDGGIGQLNAVCEALRQLDLEEDLNVCSLAKKNEDIYIPGLLKPLTTDNEQSGLKMLRLLRDEAHRFAISFHRSKRTKVLRKSQLNDIPRIGSKRIKDLLLHFKSVEAIRAASLSEIMEVPGFGEKISIEIFNYFNT